MVDQCEGRVVGVVVLADGIESTEETESALLDYLGGRLSRFKLPKRIDFVTELPRTPTGKLVKRLLRDQYVGQ